MGICRSSWDVITGRVGKYADNAWGFFDMIGNVFEWTSTKIDRDTRRIYRGGSFRVDSKYARAASASQKLPGERVKDIGVRPAWEIQDD